VSARAQVVVDPTRCQAYGVCVAINPDVFDLARDSNTVVVVRDVVDGDDRTDVEEAARNCPAQAIALRVAEEG
jgi:ferredoxin